MFFCRHQLLRPPAQRHFSNLLLTPRHAPRLVVPLPTHTLSTRYARSSSSLPDSDSPPGPSSPTESTESKTWIKLWPPKSPNDRQPREEPPKVKETDTSKHKTAPQDSNPTPDPESDRAPVKRPANRGEHVSAYLAARRTHGPDTLVHITSAAYRDIVWDTVQCKRDDVMEQLVADAAHVLRMRPNRFRYPAVFLLEELGARRLLSQRHMLVLVRALRTHGRLHQIRLTSAIEIAMGILRTGDVDSPAFGELLLLLHKWLTEVLREDVGRPDPFKYEAAGPAHRVPLLTWPLFRVLLGLAKRGEQAHASALMRQLIECRSIDAGAIEKTDLAANDYVYVVLSVLVRTCLKYGWFSRASSLLIPVVSARKRFSRPLALLVQDWLKAALDEPRDVDLTDAAAMIIMHFQRAVATVLHDSVLQQFYNAAAAARAGELAQAVYRHSRDVTHYSYNPPGGPALIWFILYLRGVRRDVHLSRVLTRHITDGKVRVVPFARTAVVYNAAAQGFTMLARTLWERWSVGPDRKYIVAASATMLRVVSAFTNTEATILRAAKRTPPSETAAPRINGPDESVDEAGDQARAVQQPAQDAVPNDRFEETNPASDAPHSPSPPPPHDDEADLSAPLPSSSPLPGQRGAGEQEDQGRIGTAGLTHEELLARAADVRRFTEHVFDAYYELKQPLETADRPTVNAVARGAFMLGRDALAFEMFALMRRRAMRLDLHDLNVVISVVAKADPAQGVARIQKMLDSGLAPDAVTYGTVIHWAIFHGNPALVRRVIEMARAHGLAHFSFKTLAALLHATVSPHFAAQAEAGSEAGSEAAAVGPGEQLETVEDILTTMLDLGIIPTPNVGRDCVQAALAAEDPVLAFRFWKVLLKDKVEHADHAQRQLRARIGRQIQEHYDAGWLDENRARAMLSELGFEIFSLVDRRRLAAKEKEQELLHLPGIGEE